MKLIDKAVHPENCPSCGNDVSPRPRQSRGWKEKENHLLPCINLEAVCGTDLSEVSGRMKTSLAHFVI